MYEKGVQLYIFHLKATERSRYPGYQRFFLAYDEELRRPLPEDTRTGNRKASGTQGKVPVFMKNNL